MPKVLLISQLELGSLCAIRQTLRTFGIDHDILIGISNTSYAAWEPIQGVTDRLNPTSTSFRDFMRRYDAVLLNIFLPADTTSTLWDPTVNTWMANWNEPQDPPVFHFGHPINTRSTLNLPSDFPIIRGNINDVANTMWRWQPEAFGGLGAARHRIGTRVRFVRENLSAYTRAYNFQWNSNTECAAYLVDILRLGGHRELLIVPDFPDQNSMPTPPDLTTPAFGVRYKNHYFLPGIHTMSASRRGHYYTWLTDGAALSWLLYALKLANIRPVRRIPIVMEFDHPIDPLPFPRDHYGNSYPQQARIQRLTMEWVRDFCKPRGTQVVLGSRTGSRYIALDGHFWRQCKVADDPYWGTGGTAQGREEANRVRVLIRDNPDAFAFGVHDHTIPTDTAGGFNNTRWNRDGITLTRHTDAGYRYAAPNPIPTRHGTVINRKVAPATYQPNNTTVFEFEKEGVRYLDINPPTTTDATANFQDGCIWTAKMLLERAFAEHADLEIPTIHGYVGYTNHARNWHGGEGYWEAWREFGVKGFRIVTDYLQGYPRGHPYRLNYRGIDFVPTVGPDMCFGATGFFHPNATYANTMFGMWSLEPTSGANAYELRGPNNEWMSDPAWRAVRGVWAIRRYLSSMMDMWLWSACVLNGTAYIHHSEANWIDPNNPLGEPFSGTWGSVTYTGVFNFVKELFLAMDELVRVLGDYIKWGTIGELMDFRAGLRW